MLRRESNETASDAIITTAAVSPKKEMILEGITLQPAGQIISMIQPPPSFIFSDVLY